MSRIRHKQIVVICLVIVTGLFSYGFSIGRVDQVSSVDLASIPQQVGDWHMKSEQTQMSSFEQGFLNNSLFRVYERPDGRAIVLAVAYGADQRQNFSIHVPEGCYRAAGFDVATIGLAHLSIPEIPIKQLVVQKEQDTESIQYWIILNGEVVTNHFERKIKQIYYSLLGARAGGVLVRISSACIEKDFARNYEIQTEFIADLYKSLNSEQKRLLFGDEKILGHLIRSL